MRITNTDKKVTIEIDNEKNTFPLNYLGYQKTVDGITLLRGKQSLFTANIAQISVNGEIATDDNIDDLLDPLFNSGKESGMALPIEIANVNQLQEKLDTITESLEDIPRTVNYSFNEQFSGRYWIDGRKIYQKTIQLPALPNNKRLDIPHNISNINYIVDINGIFRDPKDNSYVKLNHVNPLGIIYSITGYCTQTTINIITGVDRTSYTENYVTIHYTCTDR